MEHIVVFVDGDGVWNYSSVRGNGPLVADGAEEGYDSYDTVIAAVTANFPGALIAVPPPWVDEVVPVVDEADDIPGVSG